jgi:hypothetical protein
LVNDYSIGASIFLGILNEKFKKNDKTKIYVIKIRKIGNYFNLKWKISQLEEKRNF